MVGLRSRLAQRRDARDGAGLTIRFPAKSGFLALGRMCVPGAAGFRLDLGETGARRRIGNPDEMLAGRALNLPSGELRFALERLVAVGAVKLEFVCIHNLLPS